MFGLQDKVLAIIGGGLSALLLVILAYVAITDNATIRMLRKDKSDLEASVSRLTADRAICRANTSALQSSIDAQNSKIKDLQSSSDQRVARLEASLGQVSQAAKEAQKRADRILSEKGTNEPCKDANDLILKEVQ